VASVGRPGGGDVGLRRAYEPSPLARRVLRLYLAGALCLLAIGCSSGATTQAEATQGQFRLVFELPRTDWLAGDSIAGEATLSYLGSGNTGIATSGAGPIGFNYNEVGGTRHMDWVWLQSLAVFQLSTTQPISSPLKKSVAWLPDDPNAAFYSSFGHDPLIHLPAGDWTITAVASFQYGSSDPRSGQYTLQATVRLHVTA
jgi:hypothetical protein